MFKIKNEKLYYFYYILFSVLYLWTFSGPYFYFLEEISTYGDQKIYHLFYERIKELGYLESFEVYKSLFASEEIFYSLFVFISSYLGLSKASAMT